MSTVIHIVKRLSSRIYSHAMMEMVNMEIGLAIPDAIIDRADFMEIWQIREGRVFEIQLLEGDLDVAQVFHSLEIIIAKSFLRDIMSS